MSKNLKVLLVIVLSVALIMGTLTGCGQKTTDPGTDVQKTTTKEPDEEYTIGFIAMNMFMTWMQYALEGAKEVADEEGVKLIVYDAENKVDKQTSLMEDLIAQQVDAIITDPINVESLTPALEEAENAGIPVITFDRRCEGAPYFAFVGSDDTLGGKLAAQFIAERLDGKGKVIELVGAAGASPTIDRGNGFHEEMEKYPDIEIVFSQTGEFIREKGMSVMEDAINAVGDFDAVFSHNDDMMMGAIQAMKDANMDLSKVITISYDGIPDSLRSIQDGDHDATIQYPAGQAAMAMKEIIEYIKTGKQPEKKDDKIDPWVITSDNLDTGDFYKELAE